jgi:hypothetical protein
MYVDVEKTAAMQLAAATAKLGRFKKHWCIFAWKDRATALRLKHQRQEIAVRWGRQRVLAAAVHQWQEAAIQERKLGQKKQLAAAFRRGGLLLKGWRVWQKRVRWVGVVHLDHGSSCLLENRMEFGLVTWIGLDDYGASF